uniref:Uncharacterized protein LOC109680298 n=1 Tax=Castor canadensis TaxID=51338 RepID=A0A8B7TZH0_CASCN
MRINVSSRENQIHNHFFLEELKKVGREAGVQGKGTENPTSLYTGDGTALTVPIFPAFLPLHKRKKIIGKGDKLDDKVKRIGPHIEIFQVFRERSKLKITKKTVKAIITLQAHVRGWLERRRFQRIKTKALYHGPNLKAVLNMYQVQIHRVRHRLGLWRTRQVINFVELEEWMDRKKFYETMFAKREDWQGLERSELLKYFNDCGHFPTQQQVDDFWELFHRGKKRIHSEVIKKSTATEMLFTMYPPQGAHVHSCNSQLKSTWLRPIVNGEEGYKYIVSASSTWSAVFVKPDNGAGHWRPRGPPRFLSVYVKGKIPAPAGECGR